MIRASQFAGRSVIVTGGTSGIGRGICVAFGQEGANVVVPGRNQEGGQETVGLVEEAGAKAIFVRTDVTVRDDLANLVRSSIDTFGTINILVNNAGMIFT